MGWNYKRVGNISTLTIDGAALVLMAVGTMLGLIGLGVAVGIGLR